MNNSSIRQKVKTEVFYYMLLSGLKKYSAALPGCLKLMMDEWVLLTSTSQTDRTLQGFLDEHDLGQTKIQECIDILYQLAEVDLQSLVFINLIL